MDPVKSTAQTSLHSVLGIIAAIPSQVICYANSGHIFFSYTYCHLGEAEMSKFTFPPNNQLNSRLAVTLKLNC